MNDVLNSVKSLIEKLAKKEKEEEKTQQVKKEVRRLSLLKYCISFGGNKNLGKVTNFLGEENFPRYFFCPLFFRLFYRNFYIYQNPFQSD